MLVIVTATGVVLALLTALALVLRNAISGPGNLPLDAEWIDELSVERYRPMMRLLDPRELEFLRTQPGFSPSMAWRLRAQRCQIFSGYLAWLKADFSQVCTAVKLLMLHSRRDRPDLASILLRQQTAFAFGMAAVRVRLFLYRWGICGVDVAGLVRSFDAMRIELKSLAPASAAAAA